MGENKCVRKFPQGKNKIIEQDVLQPRQNTQIHSRVNPSVQIHFVLHNL